MSETDPLDLWYKAEAEATAYESAAVIWRAIKEAERRAYERAAAKATVFADHMAHVEIHAESDEAKQGAVTARISALTIAASILSLSSEETK